MDASELLTSAVNSISEGINHLCALLEWIDDGTAQASPVDSATLREAMRALGEGMREIMYGGRISGGPPITEEDLARVVQLEELMTDWTSKGALSPEVVPLAEACVSALCGGVSWRELMAAAGRRPETTRS